MFPEYDMDVEPIATVVNCTRPHKTKSANILSTDREVAHKVLSQLCSLEAAYGGYGTVFFSRDVTSCRFPTLI